jgi:hypothetical protein
MKTGCDFLGRVPPSIALQAVADLPDSALKSMPYFLIRFQIVTRLTPWQLIIT